MILIQLEYVSAVRFLGTFDVESKWHMIAKVSFGSSNDEPRITGTVTADFEDTYLLFYDSSPNSWRFISLHTHMSCKYAVRSIQQKGHAKHAVKLTPGQSTEIDVLFDTVERPETIHIAIGRCDTRDGDLDTRRALTDYHLPRFGTGANHRYSKYHLDGHALSEKVSASEAVGSVSVDLHFTNNGSEFPFGETRMFVEAWLFFILFVIFGFHLRRKVLQTILPRNTHRASLIVFRILAMAYVFGLLAVSCTVIDVTKFAITGVMYVNSTDIAQLFSYIFEELSRQMVLLVVVQMSTGWMVLTPTLRDGGLFVYCIGLMSVIYFVASLTSVYLHTGDNFTIQYHSFAWVVVFLLELFIVVAAVFQCAHFFLLREQELAPGSKYRYRDGYKSPLERVQYTSMLVIAKSLGITMLAISWDIFVTIYGASGIRGDFIYLTMTGVHSSILFLMANHFVPETFYLLHGGVSSTTNSIDVPIPPEDLKESGKQRPHAGTSSSRVVVEDSDDDEFDDDDEFAPFVA